MLDRDVLSTAQFKQYAAQKWILVELDFPRGGGVLPRNEELSRQHKVRGFPTIVLLDPQGKQLGRTGYRRGLTPAGLIAQLDQVLRK